MMATAVHSCLSRNCLLSDAVAASATATAAAAAVVAVTGNAV